MQRVILHSDFNNFYASVECLFDPSLRSRPVAVTGDPEKRHGIVLAKNDIAKRFGIKTGDVLWQARQKCPEITFVPAHYERYIRYSQLAREIYVGFTDQVEAFGLDESWLDVTGSIGLFGSGVEIADKIRDVTKTELGLTVSVGVSFNKVFAKLGSDMKKPDATTVITEESFKDVVWSLPVQDLLYVGPATTAKLARYGIHTIGKLANTNVNLLKSLLGKNGVMLWSFANGHDTSQVSSYVYTPPVKSIGNSITAPKDLVNDQQVKIVLLSLCESVAARLRQQNCSCETVHLGIRDNELFSYDRQGKIAPTNSTRDILDAAFRLYKLHHTSGRPIRSLSVAAKSLSPASGAVQLSMFPEDIRALKRRDIDSAVDLIRNKYGYTAIRRGIALSDPELDTDIKGQHIVHPIGFLGTL